MKRAMAASGARVPFWTHSIKPNVCRGPFSLTVVDWDGDEDEDGRDADKILVAFSSIRGRLVETASVDIAEDERGHG